ncbi:Uncharacterised protein [Vibrio cholerae]|nr:Uncharacterised protein [Vibrio cholerae]
MKTTEYGVQQISVFWIVFQFNEQVLQDVFV